MSHALIIDDNRIVCPAIQEHLSKSGFVSFDHAWNEKEAIWAADRRSPSLVVVGHSVDSESALEAARYVSLEGNIPLLVVAKNGFHTRRQLAGSNRVNGPYPISEIETALSLAGITIVQQHSSA